LLPTLARHGGNDGAPPLPAALNDLRHTMAKCIICDSNVHDAVAIDDGLKRLIDQCQKKGRIVLKTTPVQIAELSRIPDAKDTGQANAISAERIGSAVAVFDHSGFDEDRLGTDGANAAFEALKKGGANHVEDAMIGATALLDADILVTDDNTFRKRFEALGAPVQVMSSIQFRSYLKGLLQSDG
jgi:predicted nucleic acid-binding protein